MPANYPQYYYPQYVQPQPVVMPQPATQQVQVQNQPTTPQPQTQTTPIQNSGFVLVMSEDEAYRYPVAPGHCVTCKVVNKPIVIEKSMSFSQLDNPKIDRYRLVKEEVVDEPKSVEVVETEKSSNEELKAEIEAMRQDIEDIKKKLYSNNQNQSQNKPVAKKKEVVDND